MLISVGLTRWLGSGPWVYRELLIIKYEKNIYIYDLFASLVFGGCDLNLEPENGVTFDHYFQEESDCNALLRQMEADLRVIWSAVTFHEHMGLLTDRVYNAASIEKVRNLDPNYLTIELNSNNGSRIIT